MVVFYGDYPEKERAKAEAGSALLLQSDGNLNLHPNRVNVGPVARPVKRACGHRTKLNCVHHCTPWREKEIHRTATDCALGREEESSPVVPWCRRVDPRVLGRGLLSRGHRLTAYIGM